ncbi:hypothetical protein B0H10DRAFT_6631 [Mycena sp. CBHHK59/15]|nr:hypothetical protein B0H10DRAFT_6631 [Mycena sp. CBHHK59/15]
MRWPLPWKLPLPRPLSMHTLQQFPGIVGQLRDELEMTSLRNTWLLCLRDTPLRTLYRLYECMVDFDANEMMMESQYWFHEQHDWCLVDLPDPHDPDPVRYAILAALAEGLVGAFNYKIEMGLRRGITLYKRWLIEGFKKDSDPLRTCPCMVKCCRAVTRAFVAEFVRQGDTRLCPAQLAGQYESAPKFLMTLISRLCVTARTVPSTF